MLIEALAQLRFAASILFGRPFDVGSLERLAEGMRATRREFGVLGAEAREVVGGPALDDEGRRDMQLRAFRRQARAAAGETTYYGAVFEQLGLNAGKLAWADVARLPRTMKEAVRADPDAFLRRTARPSWRCVTTGTTGAATTIYFSADEMRSFIALGAISLLSDGSVTEEDIVQLSTSARALLGNTCFAGACARVGALVHQAGLVDAAHTLALLTETRRIPGKKSRVSVLQTYPSHLGELVKLGLAEGRRPADFGLERIIVGGELVSAGLKERARRVFGEVVVHEGFGMTEIWPLGGNRCEDGHLHFEPLHGLVEVIDPLSGEPAAPGQIGTLVATPFPPYRLSMPLLRYDTEDAVRVLDATPTCHMRHLPATGHLLGKRRLAVQHDDGWTFPRQVVEALEAVEEVPLPARCGFWAVPGGVAVEVVARADTPDIGRAVERSLEAYGVPLRVLSIVADRLELRRPLPWRCDLREAAFQDRWPAPEHANTSNGVQQQVGAPHVNGELIASGVR